MKYLLSARTLDRDTVIVREILTHLWFELERLPDQLHLLAPLVLLHHGEPERELRHSPWSPSPGTEHYIRTLY